MVLRANKNDFCEKITFGNQKRKEKLEIKRQVFNPFQFFFFLKISAIKTLKFVLIFHANKPNFCKKNIFFLLKGMFISFL